MNLDILLTPELKKTIPDTIKVPFNYGEIIVIFPNDDGTNNEMIGDNAVVSGEKQDIVNWLKPFDGIAVGCGTPQLEEFQIMHIKDDL